MVNLSSRFMAATKQFGVYLNISHIFYSYLTLQMKKYLRLIDKVTVKGSSIPIKIYCFDFNTAALGGGGNTLLDDDMINKYNSKKDVKETRECLWNWERRRAWETLVRGFRLDWGPRAGD